MAQVWEYIKIALMNIKSNKGRSILTMLGIIIGISSVIMIISIGNGIKGGINQELNAIAGGQIYIYSNATKNEEGLSVTFTGALAVRQQPEKGILMHRQTLEIPVWNIPAATRLSRGATLQKMIIMRQTGSASSQRAVQEPCSGQQMSSV